MISKRLIWYSEKLSWWLAGEMYCKLSERVGKVWKELSLMLADGGVRKEIEVCQSCRTCEDRDDANYHKLPSSTLSLYVPHHPSQCCILYQRLNFAKLTRWCICHGNRHQLDQLERWSKSRAFNRINDFTWYCIQLLHRISLDNSRKIHGSFFVLIMVNSATGIMLFGKPPYLSLKGFVISGIWGFWDWIWQTDDRPIKILLKLTCWGQSIRWKSMVLWVISELGRRLVIFFRPRFQQFAPKQNPRAGQPFVKKMQKTACHRVIEKSRRLKRPKS